MSFHKFHFANLLADGIFVSTREVWLSTSMVIWTLFTRNYTMIGYLGRSVLLEAYIYIYILFYSKAIAQQSEISYLLVHHTSQGNETKRFFVAALLEKGR